MVIRQGDDVVEVTPLERVAAHLPTPGDTRLAIRIRSGRFTGEGEVWVELPALQRFAQQLADLERNRSGHAELTSTSPDALRIRIKTTDGWGHTAIEGRLSKSKQAIEFTFEFNAEYLAGLLAEFRQLAIAPA